MGQESERITLDIYFHDQLPTHISDISDWGAQWKGTGRNGTERLCPRVVVIRRDGLISSCRIFLAFFVSRRKRCWGHFIYNMFMFFIMWLIPNLNVSMICCNIILDV